MMFAHIFSEHHMFAKLKSLQINLSFWQVLPALTLLAVLAYGLYIPWMGLFWDDWPKAWISSVSGAQSLQYLFLSRPLSGWLLSLGAGLLGESIPAWQVLTLALRILTALALWRLAGALWPRQRLHAFLLAALFLVYPGFSQQFIAISYSVHLLALALHLSSLTLMVAAANRRENPVLLTAAAIALAAASLFTTEYFFGLELLRPALLWIALANGRDRFKRVLKAWTPYLFLTATFIVWRMTNAELGGYGIAELSQPGLFSNILHAAWLSGAAAWTRLAALPGAAELGARPLLYFWALASAAALFIVALSFSTGRAQGDARWGWQALGLGLFALLAGGVPVWSAGLEIKLAFPADRLTLPLMLGSVLILVGLAELLLRSAVLRAVVFAVLIGLAVGFHFTNALSYRVDWVRQSDILQQLAWRIPGLQPRTTLISEELPVAYSTDNSLSAAINWMYATNFAPQPEDFRLESRAATHVFVPYMLRYLDLRLGWQLPPLGSGQEIFIPNVSNLRYQANVDDVVLIYYQPPYCLRVLHPLYDREQPFFLGAAGAVPGGQIPHIPEETLKALPFTRLERIIAQPDTPARLPEGITPVNPDDFWCYYFQKADLARQLGDWQTVAELGEIAFGRGLQPHYAGEAAVFIEAYAHTGNWQLAGELTRQAYQQDPATRQLMCSTWSRIKAGLSSGDSTTEEVLGFLGCDS